MDMVITARSHMTHMHVLVPVMEDGFRGLSEVVHVVAHPSLATEAPCV